MYLDQSQLKKYVFDLPGIGFKSYDGGWTNVKLKDIRRDKILVTYRDLSQINEEIMLKTKKKLKIFRILHPLFFLLGLGGLLYSYDSRNPLGLILSLPYIIELLLEGMERRKVNKIDVKNIYIDDNLKTIHQELESGNPEKAASIARDGGMDFIARLYENQ